MAKEIKKLYRTDEDKIIGGVCGGIAEYLDVDSTVIRVIYSLLTLLTGLIPGIIVYLVLLFIMPQRPGSKRKR